MRELLDKARNHHDPDIRFMAIRELTREVDAMDSIETSAQGQLRKSLLFILKDDNSDAQTAAVKLLGSVVRKVDSDNVRELVINLVKSLVEEKASTDVKKQKLQREQFQTAIKNCIKELRDDNGKESGGQMVQFLSRALINRDVQLQLICMDLLADIVIRFGKDVTAHHDQLLKRLQDKLEKYSIDDVPMKAANTIGALAKYLDDKLFSSMMEFLMTKIAENADNVMFIRCVGMISREVGFRVGGHLGKLMPLLERNCSVTALESKEEEDEQKIALKISVWVACFTAFEYFLLGCPDKMNDHIGNVIELFIAGMKYDPNFQEDNDDEMDAEDTAEWGDDGEDGEGWGDDDDNDGGGNDADGAWGGGGGVGLIDESDQSWRIRQQATKGVAAFLTNKTKMLKIQYPKSKNGEKYCDVLSAILTERLKERDDNVRIVVLSTLEKLVMESASMADSTNGGTRYTSAAPDEPPLMVRQKSWKLPMPSELSVEVLKQFDRAGNQIKCALFSLMKQLCITLQVQPNTFSIANSLAPSLDGIASEDLDVQSKAFEYLEIAARLSSEPLKDFKENISGLVDGVAKATAKTANNRVKLNALRSAGVLCRCVEKADEKNAAKLFESAFETMKIRDVDVEVKRAALTAVAQIVRQVSSALGDYHADILPVLMDRLNNSSTQLTALQSLSSIAESGALDLTSKLEEIIQTLCKFMRTQTSNQVKYESARTLEAVVQKNGKAIKAFAPSLLTEAGQHATDSDTYLCSLVLKLIGAIVKSPAQDVLKESKEMNKVMERMLLFTQSPLVDSKALTSIVECFRVVSLTVSTFDELLAKLKDIVSKDTSAHTLSVVAKCIGAMAGSASEKKRNAYIEASLGELKSGGMQIKQLALLSIGDIGRRVNLSSHKGLDQIVFSSFDQENQSIRASASYALGSITAGSLSSYLVGLLQLLDKYREYNYLLLRSVREVVSCYFGRSDEIAQFTPQIFAALVKHTDSKEEAVRAEVAECLGGLAKIEPEKTIKFLHDSLSSKTPFTRAVAVGALRYSLSDEVQEVVGTRFGQFLRMFEDSDLEVRRQAVLTFEAVLKSTDLVNKAENSKLMETVVVQTLYQELEPNQNFIRIMDAGALKIRIDNHLPLRRAAFDTLATIIRVCPYRLNMDEFYQWTMQGLLDPEEDIVTRTWDMYFQITQNPSLRSSLRNLGSGKARKPITDSKGKSVQAMHKILLTFIKKKMITLKQVSSRETESASECTKKALMTVFTMVEIPGMEEQAADFTTLVGRIKQTKGIAKEIVEANNALKAQR